VRERERKRERERERERGRESENKGTRERRTREINGRSGSEDPRIPVERDREILFPSAEGVKCPTTPRTQDLAVDLRIQGFDRAEYL